MSVSYAGQEFRDSSECLIASSHGGRYPGVHMHDLLSVLRQRATERGKTIVLPESSDPRVLTAAARASAMDLCRPLLIGDADSIRRQAEEMSLDLPPELPILDPATDPQRHEMIEALERIATERGLSGQNSSELVDDPLYYANLLVHTGRAHGAVMGAVATTRETLRAALRVVGVHPEYRLVTSCFLMVLADGRPLIYSDCGVVPRPSGEQLAVIAMLAAEAFRLLVNDEPRVALLSFSTLGSAHHESLEPVLQARDILRQRQQDGTLDFDFDGELQGDAALVPEIAQRKAPNSLVAGRANVMVFPDLNSGNIAYKLTERLAGARAIGPLLRGLASPIHDLSRGCSVDDLLDTMAITALEQPYRQLIGGSE